MPVRRKGFSSLMRRNPERMIGRARLHAPALKLATMLMLAAAPTAGHAQDAGSDTPGYSRRGADTCLSCHEDEHAQAMFRTAHGNPANPRGPFGNGQLQCEACHGPGGAHAARVRRGRERPPVIRFGHDSGTAVVVQNTQCLNCHEIDVAAGWHGGAHAAADVACADCHTGHSPQDPMLTTAAQADVCTGCHVTARAQALRPFAHPLHDGKMACSGCHSPHGSSARFALARETVNDTCYQCHADKRGPFLWEHAPVAEDCTLCHSPHGSNQPGMLTMRAPLLCQTCHEERGHPSVPEGPGRLASALPQGIPAAGSGSPGLPQAPPSPFLLAQSCVNCHSQIHGSNHPSGSRLMR